MSLVSGVRPTRGASFLEGANALGCVVHVAQVVEHLTRCIAVRVREIARAALRVERAFAEREHRRRLVQQPLAQLLRLRSGAEWSGVEWSGGEWSGGEGSTEANTHAEHRLYLVLELSVGH